MKIRPYNVEDESDVIFLWEMCELVVTKNNPSKDITTKLNDSPELFLVGEISGTIVDSIMIGYEGRRGWINYLAVHPEFQRQGLAKKLVDECERVLKDMGCSKVNLQVRSSNTGVVDFYHRLGFSIDDVISMGKRLDS